MVCPEQGQIAYFVAGALVLLGLTGICRLWPPFPVRYSIEVNHPQQMRMVHQKTRQMFMRGKRRWPLREIYRLEIDHHPAAQHHSGLPELQTSAGAVASGQSMG